MHAEDWGKYKKLPRNSPDFFASICLDVFSSVFILKRSLKTDRGMLWVVHTSRRYLLESVPLTSFHVHFIFQYKSAVQQLLWLSWKLFKYSFWCPEIKFIKKRKNDYTPGVSVFIDTNYKMQFLKSNSFLHRVCSENVLLAAFMRSWGLNTFAPMGENHSWC